MKEQVVPFDPAAHHLDRRDHVEGGDAFRDTEDRGDPGRSGLHDRIRGAGRRDEDERGVLVDLLLSADEFGE